MAINYYGIEGDWSPFPSYSNAIWTNGCYDILHIGHLELLAKCKEESNKLSNSLVFVGLDSDKRIKQTKGDQRPINDELTRISMMLSLKYVDGVFTFDTEEDLIDLLSEIKPTKIVIGEEYKDKKVVGKQFANEVLFFPKVKDFSTTNIIKSIKNI